MKQSSSPIRVLHITGSMDKGGAETVVMNLYRNIDRAAIQFDFLYFTDRNCAFDMEILQLGGRIFRVGSTGRARHWRRIQFVMELLRRDKFAIVHVHTAFNAGLILLLAKMAGVPMRIAHAHTTKDGAGNGLVRLAYQWLSRRLVRYAVTRMVACSKQAGRFLFGRPFLRQGVIVPNAIDPNRFFRSQEDCRKKICQELNLDPVVLIVGQVGRLIPVKNHAHTLRVVSDLLQNGRQFCVLFVGTGREATSLQQQVVALGLERHVRFLGERDDVAVLMNSFDLLLMPSLYEGVPVTLIEAQAAGIPCVISDRISTEADLGLGLITYCSLEAGTAVWIEAITAAATRKGSVPEDARQEAFIARRYDVRASAEFCIKDVYGIF